MSTRSIGVILSCLFSGIIFSCSEVKERPLNIVLIVADDLGWRDVAYNDNSYFLTPNIDLLSEEGLIFTNAYSNAPNCAPTRAALLTGLYAPRTGIYTVAGSARGKSEDRKLIPIENTTVLDTSFVTIAEVLQQNGYATGHFGKWHLGTNEFGPQGQGFDLNVAGNQAGSPRSYFSPYQNPNLPDGDEGEHITDRLAKEAVQFISEHTGDPFFVYLPFYSVHTPIQAKPGLIAKYEEKPSPLSQKDARYGAMVETMDRGVGEVLRSLDSLGLAENTIVIFMSDNGPYFPVSSVEPLRGSKGMLYEGGIRIPFVIRGPGIKKGEIDIPIVGLDVFPTLLDLTGTKYEGLLDGESLVPIINSQEQTRKPIYWHFPAYLGGYAGMDLWRTTPVGVIRKGDFKLIEFFEDSTLELYNIRTDPSEKINLADSLPYVKEQLYKEMLEWRKDVQAPVPTKLNPEWKQKKDH